MLAAVIGTLALGQWLLLHRVEWRRAPVLLGMAIVMNVVLLTLFWLGLAERDVWRAIVHEDGPVEWATVFLFVVAGGLYAWRAISGSSLFAPRKGERHPITTIGNWGFAAFCIFVAGEEMSWGQRFFGFTPPVFFLENNAQQEFNAHNFMNGAELVPGWTFDSSDVMAIVGLGLGLIAPIVLLARRAPTFKPFRPLVPTLPVGALFVATATIGIWNPLANATEVAEFILGAAFVMAAIEPRTHDVTFLDESAVTAHTLRGRFRLLAWGAGLIVFPMALAAVTPVLLDRMLIGDESTAIAQAKREVSILAKSIQANEAGFEKIHLHDRMFIALKKLNVDGADFTKALHAGESSTESDVRSTYFLDPWGNPYWLLTFPRNGKFVLYSVGPNQRRDFNPVRRRAPVGDDIVARMTFSSRAPAGLDLQALVDALQEPTLSDDTSDDDTASGDTPPSLPVAPSAGENENK